MEKAERSKAAVNKGGSGSSQSSVCVSIRHYTPMWDAMNDVEASILVIHAYSM